MGERRDHVCDGTQLWCSQALIPVYRGDVGEFGIQVPEIYNFWSLFTFCVFLYFSHTLQTLYGIRISKSVSSF